MCWGCCYGPPRGRRPGKARDVIYCVFSALFTYALLPAGIVFEVVWSILLATSSVKTFTFMLTGSHSVFGNRTVTADDTVITLPEVGLGLLVAAASATCMVAYMWIRHRSKIARHRGGLLPYTVDPHAIPLALQGEPDPVEYQHSLQAQEDTFRAFVGNDK